SCADDASAARLEADDISGTAPFGAREKLDVSPLGTALTRVNVPCASNVRNSCVASSAHCESVADDASAARLGAGDISGTAPLSAGAAFGVRLCADDELDVGRELTVVPTTGLRAGTRVSAGVWRRVNALLG